MLEVVGLLPGPAGNMAESQTPLPPGALQQHPRPCSRGEGPPTPQTQLRLDSIPPGETLFTVLRQGHLLHGLTASSLCLLQQ